MSNPSRPARGRASRSRASGTEPRRSRGAGPGGSRGGGNAGVAVRGERPRGAARRSPAGRARSAGDHGLHRLRILLASTMGAVLTGYTLLVPVAALVAGSGGAPVTADGALATAVPMWLAAHQIPIALDGHALGVLPLLPTLVVVVMVACFSQWAVRRLGGRVRHDAGAVVASQAGAAAAVAVLAGALLPKEMAVTAPWASLAGAGAIGGIAAGAGVIHACGLPAAWKRVLAGWPGAALAGIRVAATGLLLTASLLLTGALLLAAPAVTDAGAGLGPGTGAALGVLALVVGYLPNALVGALSWGTGAGVSIGVATSGPLLAEPGPLPGFPLTVILPVTAVPTAAPLVFLLPVSVGVLTGLACRRALRPDAPVVERVAAPVTAAAVVALGVSVLATVAGGPLAGGPYDPVSFNGGAVLGAVLSLVGLPALLTCAGPELARHVPVGGAGGRSVSRAAGGRVRGSRSPGVRSSDERRRTSSSGERRRTSGSGRADRAGDGEVRARRGDRRGARADDAAPDAEAHDPDPDRHHAEEAEEAGEAEDAGRDRLARDSSEDADAHHDAPHDAPDDEPTAGEQPPGQDRRPRG